MSNLKKTKVLKLCFEFFLPNNFLEFLFGNFYLDHLLFITEK